MIALAADVRKPPEPGQHDLPGGGAVLALALIFVGLAALLPGWLRRRRES